jgi:ribosomal protein S12 methylthiotransferase
MSELLADSGYRTTDEPELADYLIVNTCGFLETAKAEAIDTLREMAASKRPEQRLIAAGCLAQRAGADLAHQVPGLDGIIGIRSWSDIALFLEELSASRRQEPLFHLPETGNVPVERVPLRRSDQGPRASAYLKIGDGCSAPCAFCAIPYIKGPARSRPRNMILCEAQALVEHGAQEIILIAQDTTAYGHDRGEAHGLPTLIEGLLHATPDLRWLRLMYTYPGHGDERLVEVMASHSQVCHYLDMPLQHGHPDTLRRMRRPHNVERTLRWMESLRSAMPDITLRTTFIVGYPGETGAEFQGLLDFMRTVEFDRVGIFTFSREPDTDAYDLPHQVSSEVKEARYKQAMEQQQAISLAKNQAQIGRTLEVLVEGVGDGLTVARSYRDAPEIDGFVLIEEELPVDQMWRVLVTDATVYDLMASSSQPSAISRRLERE